MSFCLLPTNRNWVCIHITSTFPSLVNVTSHQLCRSSTRFIFPMYPDRFFSLFSPHFLILRLIFPLLPLLIKAKRASSIDFIFLKDASENLILTWLAGWLWLGLFMSLQPVLLWHQETHIQSTHKSAFLHWAFTSECEGREKGTPLALLQSNCRSSHG